MKINKPGVQKHWLLLISGIIWSGVGVLLVRIAFRWIPQFTSQEKLLVMTGGVLLGLAIAYFGFSIVVRKNIRRIFGYRDLVCVFAFQEWKSYVLIAVMMSMGIFLRSTSLIPRQLVTPVYIGIGVAMFLDSFLYYKAFVRNEKCEQELRDLGMLRR